MTTTTTKLTDTTASESKPNAYPASESGSSLDLFKTVAKIAAFGGAVFWMMLPSNDAYGATSFLTGALIVPVITATSYALPTPAKLNMVISSVAVGSLLCERGASQSNLFNTITACFAGSVISVLGVILSASPSRKTHCNI